MKTINNIDYNIYLPIDFYIRTKIIDLSKDTIKRRIRKLKNNSGSIIKLMRINKIERWTINYNGLKHFKRIRNHKKTTIPCQQQKTKVISSKVDRNYKYEFELTINLLDGCGISNAKGGSYDIEYYKYLVTKIYELNRRDMFFVVEKDKSNIFHLHVGINGNKGELLVIIDHILQQIAQDNDINSLNLKKEVHFSKVIDAFLFKEYMKKNDGLIGQHETVSFIYEDENKGI
ncbi:hypothetical protein [Myroides sp. DW712]|uniref:hypothetical protein n=1 Tax=Myroides sp. DW712 TaxID=3389800 RepID=UPI00397E40F0